MFFMASAAALYTYLQQTRELLIQSRLVKEGNAAPLTQPDLLLDLGAVLTADHLSRIHMARIRQMSDGMVSRLRDELFSLSRRASVNLTVGSIVCGAGLLLLGYFVIRGLAGADYVSVVLRFSLVIFVEIFAYFFLNLYRTLLFDIKYYQNEITNATFRVMAIEGALISGDMGKLNTLCDELMKTDRNATLKKDETTREMRQAQSMKEHDKVIFTFAENIVESVWRGRRASRERRGRAAP
jgi:hypothetical protein